MIGVWASKGFLFYGVGELVNWWERRIYLVLIFGTIGAMLVHSGLLFHKKNSSHWQAEERPLEKIATIKTLTGKSRGDLLVV
jgi:hypothetical protein